MTTLWDRVKKVFVDPDFNEQMDGWEDGVYRRTANPNATDSEFDIPRFENPDESDEIEEAKVQCSIDDDEVECITFKLEEDGYTYDRGNDWWERTWTTNNGKETIREVFQQLESGKWNKLMIGYGDTIFYENQVDPE